MKILMWVGLYLVIGIVMAVIASRNLRIDRGYSVRDFDDLDSDEQTMMVATIAFWPLVIIIIAFYLLLNCITIITNRKDDDSK